MELSGYIPPAPRWVGDRIKVEHRRPSMPRQLDPFKASTYTQFGYPPALLGALSILTTHDTFTMKFTIVAAVLAAAASLTFAAPVEERDVYSPKVLYPSKGTVWYSGQTHNVTW